MDRDQGGVVGEEVKEDRAGLRLGSSVLRMTAAESYGWPG